MCMLPERCSVMEAKKQCVNPPEFVVSIVADDGEYMVGVTCQRHKNVVSGKIKLEQKNEKMWVGVINFTPVKAVGTDCIRKDPGDFVQIANTNQVRQF